MHPITHRSRFLLALLVLSALALGACGGGGSAIPVVLGDGPPPAAEITTTSLPGTAVGAPVSWTLTATNLQGEASWDIASGALPDGLTLSASGVISGAATEEGTFDFVARVTDDATTDTQALQVLVGVMELAVSEGLVHGDAWTQRPVTLTTNGATGSVSFSIVATGSGGSLTATDPVAGTATYTPGATGGTGVLDTIRATDQGGGGQVEVSFSVMPDPSANHVAAFGSTDVWWVDANQKFGGHAYATDLHQALVDVGLRAPSSTGPTGTLADELALLWFRIELLRQVNVMFLRNADGSAGAEGLAISFPFEEPGAGYSKPAAASTLFGSPTRYSQMGLTHGTTDGVIGTAFVDGSNNNRHENDTNSGPTELGVFANQITPFFNSSYRNTLDDDPVDAADVPALKALLYGLSNPGGRYTLLRDMGRGFARSMAAVLAHEVGHSLGLGHTTPSESGSIMNPSASISPNASYRFTDEDVATLQSALPGSGKSSGGLVAAQKAGGGVPEGGVVVCRCRVCTDSHGK